MKRNEEGGWTRWLLWNRRRRLVFFALWPAVRVCFGGHLLGDSVSVFREVVASNLSE